MFGKNHQTAILHLIFPAINLLGASLEFSENKYIVSGAERANI